MRRWKMQKPRLKNLKEIKTPLGIVTATLSLLIVLSYFILAYGRIFIPNPQILAYGFSFNNPTAILTYPFLHLSPQHILANIALLIAVGIIAEKKLRNRDYLAIFFSSAITAAITFQVITPHPTVLVGASAAVSGIMAAAIFVDIKKALISILVFALFLNIASPLIMDYTETRYAQLQNRTLQIEEEFKDIEEEIEQTKEQKESYMDIISHLHHQCVELGNQSACEELEKANETLEEKEKEEEQLKERKNESFEEFNQTVHEEQKIEEGIKREERAKTSGIVHLVGALTGLLYLAIFRRDIIWNMPSQVLRLEDYYKKLKKK